MRTDLLVAVILICSAPACAQEFPPLPRKPVILERIVGPAGIVAGLYETDADGTVSVDWRAVELMAKTPHRSEQPLAAMMLAVRDGRWRPMK
jgi:hypothetical protein